MTPVVLFPKLDYPINVRRRGDEITERDGRMKISPAIQVLVCGGERCRGRRSANGFSRS